MDTEEPDTRTGAERKAGRGVAALGCIKANQRPWEVKFKDSLVGEREGGEGGRERKSERESRDRRHRKNKEER